MGILDALQRRIHGAQDWPPEEVKHHWEKVEEYQRRFLNDPEDLIMYNPRWSGDAEQADLYTPVPLAKDIARMSAALMFSAAPTILQGESQASQEDLDNIVRVNGLEPRLQSMAEAVATEGRGAFRIFWDDEATGGEEVPVIDHVHENQILWTVKHNHFIIAGTVVIERDADNGRIYRMLEEHGRGYVTRVVFKGDESRLGVECELTDPDVMELFPDYEGFEATEETGLLTPTLVRWDNVPGGMSDLMGLELYLDRLDEGESLLLDKARKSVPVTFADKSMLDDNERLVIPGVIFLKAAGLLPQDGNPFVETIEPGFDVEPHLRWIEHVRESILMYAGYSLASWGLDAGASYSSGKELTLRQSRTLLSKAGKDRMALEAMRTAFATAVCLMHGIGDIQAFKPDVTLGDGLPEDAIENAQQIQLEDSAGAVSLTEKIRVIRPNWTEEQVEEMKSEIQEDARKTALLEAAASPNTFAPPGGSARGVQGDSSKGGGRQGGARNADNASN